MRKKYISLLTGIMTATVALLILVQAAWIENAMIIEEQKFTESVNKALFEVVKTAEEREALLQITQSSVPFSKDNTGLPGSKFLFEENFVEDNDFVENGTTQNQPSIYYLQGDSLYRIDAETQDSLGSYDEFTQEDLKERIIANKKVYSIGLGALIICLEKDISNDVIEGIIELKEELKPEVIRVVFSDASFKDDSIKANAVNNLKQNGIEDIRSI